MAGWSREEVEATVSDYFEMLGAELADVPYSKAGHRRRLVERLQSRSEASVEVFYMPPRSSFLPRHHVYQIKPAQPPTNKTTKVTTVRTLACSTGGSAPDL
jgi:hypothetical protein